MMSIKELKVVYRNHTVLDNFNADIEPGINCIIGKNGSGKTTLLKAIEGIVPVNSGIITYENKNVLSFGHHERAKVISYLPQNRPIPSIEGGLLIEHARFPYTSNNRKLSVHDEDMINEAISLTDTNELLSKKLSEMSGGERQRIFLAGIFAQDTPIILLDEPTNSLDLKYQIEILNLIKKMQDHLVIMVLHDLVQAFNYADKIIILNNGLNVLSGKPEEIYNNPIIKEIFHHAIGIDNDSNALYKYKLLN